MQDRPATERPEDRSAGPLYLTAQTTRPTGLGDAAGRSPRGRGCPLFGPRGAANGPVSHGWLSGPGTAKCTAFHVKRLGAI